MLRAFCLLFLGTACTAPARPPKIDFGAELPPVNQIFSFEVITDPDETLIAADAGMPAHNHGINTTPEVLPLGDRHFRVDGMLLHMPGAWEIYLDLRADNGTERRVVIPLQLELGQ